ncbi:hypothetical protein [Pantoea sp. 1.19]|uniref:hypothetical protein n=1 Tax=Pantoea sp. 1.19 TaxID=1925589 RepID=UPI000948CAEC|nr:hypothetical protein [Pantoea sp. 1.19]
MSRIISAEDACCQISQAQAVLSLWLEAESGSNERACQIIGTLITLLDGVPEAVDALIGDVMRLENNRGGGKP